MRNAVQLIVDYGFEKFLVVVLFVFILDYRFSKKQKYYSLCNFYRFYCFRFL